MLSSDKFLSLVLHFSQILVLTLECIHVCSWTLTLKMHQENTRLAFVVDILKNLIKSKCNTLSEL